MNKKAIVIYVLNAVEYAISAIMLLCTDLIFSRSDPSYALLWVIIRPFLIAKTVFFILHTIRFFGKNKRIPHIVQHVLGIAFSVAVFGYINFLWLFAIAYVGEDLAEFVVSTEFCYLVLAYFFGFAYLLTEIGLFVPSIVLRAKLRRRPKAEKIDNEQNENAYSSPAVYPEYEQENSDNGVIDRLSPFEEYSAEDNGGQDDGSQKALPESFNNDDDLF